MAIGSSYHARVIAAAAGASIVGALLMIHFAFAKTGQPRHDEARQSSNVDVTTPAGAPTSLLASAEKRNAAWPGIKTRDFELRDWFAFGSGCRSRPSLPGDVNLDVKEAAPGAYRVEITLKDFGISRGEQVALTVPSFARECGIRLAIHPAAGQRLRAVTAAPIYRVDKPKGPRVRLRGRLLMGDATLSRFEKWFEHEETAQDRQLPIEWQPDPRAQTLFEGLSCAQPKVVGLDLSAAVVREETGPSEVTVSMSNRLAEIILHFEACGSLSYSTQRDSWGDTPSKQRSEQEAP